jgi:hypothetical protein
MADPDFRQLMGIVEVEETYIGGKAENTHQSKRDELKLVGTKGKTPVIGALRGVRSAQRHPGYTSASG